MSSVRQQVGTEITFKSSGGDGAITMTSVANNAARQSAKIDLGALRAARYVVRADVELAATPTAGNVIELWWNPSSSGTAGTDNRANASGTDAAYSGYSSNLDASLPQLQPIGVLVCTAQATSTVQKGVVSEDFRPLHRYGSLIVVNRSGAAFHSSASNVVFTLTPIEDEVS